MNALVAGLLLCGLLSQDGATGAQKSWLAEKIAGRRALFQDPETDEVLLSFLVERGGECQVVIHQGDALGHGVDKDAIESWALARMRAALKVQDETDGREGYR